MGVEAPQRILSEREELAGREGRYASRIAVFMAVDQGREPKDVFPVYERYEKYIVSSGFDRWQQRVTQIKDDERPGFKEWQQQVAMLTRRDELRRIFERDVAIAERYKKGITINGRKVGLGDLIGEELAQLVTIRNKLGKPLAPVGR
jgi:hypothetical protein